MILARLSKIQSKGKTQYVGHIAGCLVASMSREGDLILEFLEDIQPSLFAEPGERGDRPGDEF